MFCLTTSFRLAIAITPILRTTLSLCLFAVLTDRCPRFMFCLHYVSFGLRLHPPYQHQSKCLSTWNNKKHKFPRVSWEKLHFKVKKVGSWIVWEGKKTVINLISSSNIYQRETSRRSHNSRQRKSAQTANGCLPSAWDKTTQTMEMKRAAIVSILKHSVIIRLIRKDTPYLSCNPVSVGLL